MGTNARHLSIVLLTCTVTLPASKQTALPVAKKRKAAGEQNLISTETPRFSATASETASVQALLDFKTSDMKFNLQKLTEILRDRRHEG